jgi:putative photosynthetic complex assembly protein
MRAAGAVSRPPAPSPVPLPLLLGIGALLLAVFAATVLVRPEPGGDGSGARRGGPAPVYVDLRFEDLHDGAVAVRRAEDGAEVALFAPGTEGFMRATLRGLARERKRGGLGPEAPFRLSAWADGDLRLEDLATGRALDMRAFGQTQAENFARLLHATRKEDGR